ncbi:unnamed protein product [Cochlearia groenlandica]
MASTPASILFPQQRNKLRSFPGGNEATFAPLFTGLASLALLQGRNSDSLRCKTHFQLSSFVPLDLSSCPETLDERLCLNGYVCFAMGFFQLLFWGGQVV